MPSEATPSSALGPSLSARAWRPVFWAGLACGILDIAAAMLASAAQGGTPTGVLQSVASALLGRAAFQSGAAAAMGLLMHFGIAFAAAAIFHALARRAPALLKAAAVPAGFAYGAVVYAVMYWGVIPLSALVRGTYLPDTVVRIPPFTLQALIIHLFFVGLPIALVIRHFSGAVRRRA